MNISHKPFRNSGIIICIFFLFAHINITAHFGWNKMPETVIEAVMDLTCIIGVLVGCCLGTVGLAIRKGQLDRSET